MAALTYRRVHWFPIPMRGNEIGGTGGNGDAGNLFPIPMRGNETGVVVSEYSPYGVSNPHEG